MRVCVSVCVWVGGCERVWVSVGGWVGGGVSTYVGGCVCLCDLSERGVSPPRQPIDPGVHIALVLRVDHSQLSYRLSTVSSSARYGPLWTQGGD
jgi:hypothetical protein